MKFIFPPFKRLTIGGGIAGLMGVANMLVVKSMPKVWIKFLVSLTMLLATFGICYVGALIYIGIVA